MDTRRELTLNSYRFEERTIAEPIIILNGKAKRRERRFKERKHPSNFRVSKQYVGAMTKVANQM